MSNTKKEIDFISILPNFSGEVYTNQKKSKFCTDICDIKVLLIDDSVFNSSCLEAILYECFRFKSISFESGFDAVSCYQSRLS
jgi:hypothetical protein